MLALALETSTRAASVALVWVPSDGAETHFAATLDGERPHVAELLPLAAGLFAAAGCSPRDLTHVFVGIGPGSYTGLRVGVSLTLGLAVGPEPPLLFGVPSPEALLWAQLAEGEAGHWLGDARAGTWYRSAARRAPRFEVTLAPSLIPDAELLPTGRLFTDADSAPRLVECLTRAGRAFAPPEVHAPHATDVLGLGRERLRAGLAPSAPSELAPLYLREFAAKVRVR